jgi:hypothetical protein
MHQSASIMALSTLEKGHHQFQRQPQLGIHTPQPLQAQLLSQVQVPEPEQGQLSLVQLQGIFGQ